ncbi:MAG: hypothetical protein E7409_05420 [Ruminococcaceae bacterium]|nr:hypothetical protein [Oscillospiraceae bacterium]
MEKDLLQTLLSADHENQTAKLVQQINQNNIRDNIARVDKEAALRALEKLNLGDMADKLRKTSTDDMMRALAENPQVLDKLKQLFQ